jgi:hypothetical protein
LEAESFFPDSPRTISPTVDSTHLGATDLVLVSKAAAAGLRTGLACVLADVFVGDAVWGAAASQDGASQATSKATTGIGKFRIAIF